MSTKNEMARREMLLAAGAGVGLLGFGSLAEAMAAPTASARNPWPTTNSFYQTWRG